MLRLKRISILTVLAVFVQFGLHSQVVSIDYVLTVEVQSLTKISLPKKNCAILEIAFGDSEILDTALLDSLNDSKIEKIDLVYTQYVQSETFVQPELNRKRLENLKQLKPFIFENNLITWNIICQTGAKSPEEAEKYFHGFIIHFRVPSEGEEVLTTAKELEKCSSILSECIIGVGDTVRDITDILKFGDVHFVPGVKVDSFIRVPEGKQKGKFLKIDPSSIPDQAYFQRKAKFNNVSFNPGFNDTITMETNFSVVKRLKVDGTYVPRSKRKREKGITYDKRSIWKRRQLTEKHLIKDTIFLIIDTFYVLESADSLVFRKSCYAGIASRNFRDTIVTRTLNNIRNWENKIIVEDVTGSMSPYLTQTLLWRRLVVDSTRISRFVYFNDGDNKSDHEKIIGRTGGLHYIESSSIRMIEEAAFGAMAAGNGGDGPENNLEALIYANKICPSCEPLMIADNYAPIKALVLLNQITKPVDVILCGVHGGMIQSNYLSLVLKTGGSIFTMEGELRDLSLLKEGETIEFGGQKFIIHDGQFILTR